MERPAEQSKKISLSMYLMIKSLNIEEGEDIGILLNFYFSLDSNSLSSLRVITCNGEYCTDDVCQSEVEEQNIGSGEKMSRNVILAEKEIPHLDCEVARLEQIF